MRLFGPVIYACAKRSWLSVDNLKNGKRFEAPTRVAVTMKEGKPHRVVGLENEPLSGKVEDAISYVDAFDHSRTWVSSPELAGTTLFMFVRKVLTSRLLLKPVVLFHPLFSPDGDWSDFELRNIGILWAEAGARRFMVCMEPGPYATSTVLEKLDAFREITGIHVRK